MFAQQMNLKFAAIFVFSAICACCVSCSNDHVDDEPRFDWTLDVDEPIKQLEEILSETSQQQPMNYTSCNLVSLYDVKLALLFHRYVVSLPLAKRAAAISEQDRWKKQTEKAMNDAHIEWEGGSGQIYAVSMAYLEAAKPRIAEIEQRLKEAAPKKVK